MKAFTVWQRWQLDKPFIEQIWFKVGLSKAFKSILFVIIFVDLVIDVVVVVVVVNITQPML